MGITALAFGAFAATVAYIYDGDTFRTYEGDRVRIWGLDAPEMDERGGVRAKDTLHYIIAESDGSLTCYEMGRDRYGRVVARCETRRGDDIACLMIWRGVADEWWDYSQNYYAGCRAPRDNNRP